MRQKYLNKLSNIERWAVSAAKKSIREMHTKERSEFGFDSHECYRMDLPFITWLYERVYIATSHNIVMICVM